MFTIKFHVKIPSCLFSLLSVSDKISTPFCTHYVVFCIKAHCSRINKSLQYFNMCLKFFQNYTLIWSVYFALKGILFSTLFALKLLLND